MLIDKSNNKDRIRSWSVICSSRIVSNLVSLFSNQREFFRQNFNSAAFYCILSFENNNENGRPNCQVPDF